MKINQKGNTPILITIAVLGVLGFFATSYFGDFNENIFKSNYSKPSSHASEDHSQIDMKGRGLVGRYFKSEDFSGDSTSKIDPEIDLQFSEDNFSARWIGLIIPPSSGQYTFYAKTNQGVRIYINNQPLIAQMSNNIPNEYSGSIELVAEKGYPIVLEYSGTKGSLQFLWSSAEISKQVVPNQNLHTGSDDQISI